MDTLRAAFALRFVGLGLLWACGAPASGAEPAAAESSGSDVAATEPAAEEAAPEEAPSMVDPVKASPDVFKVILEGPRARVLEATWQPGQRDNFHAHPTLIAYAVTPIFGLAYDPDGESTSIRIPQGRVLKQAEVGAHAFHNSAKTVAKMIIIELKPGAGHVRMPKDAVDAMVAAPEVFELMAFDTEARVLLGTWKPGQKEAVHGHPSLTIYAITDMQGIFYDAEGKPQDVSLKAGTAMFVDPVKAHQFQNTGSAEAQLLLVEQRK